MAVPAKVRLPPRETALVIVALTEASRVPPLTVRAPAAAPKAKVAEPAVRVPAERVVPPV